MSDLRLVKYRRDSLEVTEAYIESLWMQAADVERVFKDVSEYLIKWDIGHTMYCNLISTTNGVCDCGAAEAQRLLDSLKEQP